MNKTAKCELKTWMIVLTLHNKSLMPQIVYHLRIAHSPAASLAPIAEVHLTFHISRLPSQQHILDQHPRK